MSRKRKVGILPKNGPALLSIIEDVFPRWRDRLRSGRDAADELEEFLRSPETRSAYVSAGEETLTLLPVEFWQNTARLEVVPDLVDDRVMVDFTPYVHLQPDDTAEFFVRASDVEHWELRHPELAPPSTAAAPAVSEVATQNVSRGRRQSVKETRVLEALRKLDSECRVRDDMQPAEVEKIVKPHYRDVSRRVIARAYKKFLKEPRAK